MTRRDSSDIVYRWQQYASLLDVSPALLNVAWQRYCSWAHIRACTRRAETRAPIIKRENTRACLQNELLLSNVLYNDTLVLRPSRLNNRRNVLTNVIPRFYKSKNISLRLRGETNTPRAGAETLHALPLADFFRGAALHNSADTKPTGEKNSLKPQITYERLNNERGRAAPRRERDELSLGSRSLHFYVFPRVSAR